MVSGPAIDSEEVRSVAFARINTADSPARGLTGVTVRSTSRLRVMAQYDATIAVGSCPRVIDFVNDPPSWNEYATGHSWTSPGGDFTTIGTLNCTENTPAYLTGSGLAAGLQTMVNGQANNFIFRMANEYALDVPFTASLEIEFDLAVPPN